MPGPTQIVVRVTASQYADLNAVAEQLSMTVSEMIREMVEESLPKYKEKAEREGAKLRAGKAWKQQVEEATYALVDELRTGRLVLSTKELTAPKALAVADLIHRIRPDGEERPAVLRDLRSALLKALEGAPDVSIPEPTSKPERIRAYKKANPEKP
jgi:Ribbon-helix-helix domain